MSVNTLPVIEGRQGPRIKIDGREYDYFDMCSYFSLQGNQEIIDTACQATQEFGLTTSISRHIVSPLMLKVQAAACRFFEAEAALYHPTGYEGNAIILEGLKDAYDIIFMDEISHYSIQHAVAVVRKPVVTFAHRDADDLRKKIKATIQPSQRPLLISDGCFPISGQLAPLKDYHAVMQEYKGFHMAVDDAHITGVIGKKGHGSFEYFGLHGDTLHTSGTLSKAMGAHGGIITGPQEYINKLKKYSIGATSSAVPVAAAAIAALDYMRTHPQVRQQLWDLVAYAKAGLRALGFDIPDTPVPIICLHTFKKGDPQSLRETLFAKGIHFQYRAEGSYTSVPRGGSNRIAIMVTHTREQIDRLVGEVGAYLRAR
jgi:7-keto-8-aminopelargonate synthetase-like enzyme